MFISYAIPIPSFFLTLDPAADICNRDFHSSAIARAAPKRIILRLQPKTKVYRSRMHYLFILDALHVVFKQCEFDLLLFVPCHAYFQYDSFGQVDDHFGKDKFTNLSVRSRFHGYTLCFYDLQR